LENQIRFIIERRAFDARRGALMLLSGG